MRGSMGAFEFPQTHASISHRIMSACNATMVNACSEMFQCVDDFCEHVDLFPSFTGWDGGGTTLAFLAVVLASMCGTGGGGIMVLHASESSIFFRCVLSS